MSAGAALRSRNRGLQIREYAVPKVFNSPLIWRMASWKDSSKLQDLDEEVNGVAGQVALGPAPVVVFNDQARKGGQNKIARLAFDRSTIRTPRFWSSGASGARRSARICSRDQHG